MRALHPRSALTTDGIRQPHHRGSKSKDNVGLAWYLARAIVRGDANFYDARAESHARASHAEQVSSSAAVSPHP